MAHKTASWGGCGRHLAPGCRRRSPLTVHLKPYWGKPTVRNFRGGRGNPKLDRARRAPFPYSAVHHSGNPVSVHHSCPKKRTDTGLRGGNPVSRGGNPVSGKSGVGSSFSGGRNPVSVGRNPVSVHHSGPKSGVGSSFWAEIRCRFIILEIRCQFIILVWKSGGNPVSVHHSCPKRRTDTGLRRELTQDYAPTGLRPARKDEPTQDYAQKTNRHRITHSSSFLPENMNRHRARSSGEEDSRSLKPFRWNPAGNQSRPVEPDQQPEASLAWRVGDHPCEA